MNAVPTIRVEDIASHAAFRRLASIAGIAFDLRYATTNNFDGRVLYEGIDCAWLRAEAAAGLEAAAAWLARTRPGHRLVVLDARPCFEYYPPDAECDPQTGAFACQICIPVVPL